MEITDESVRRSLQRRNRGGRGTQWDKLLAITDGLCFYCGIKLTADNRSRDHVHPRSRGGLGKRYNLVPACKECNVAKGSKSVNIFRRITIGNEWFHGERAEIERMIDIGAISREMGLALLDEGPLGDKR